MIYALPDVGRFGLGHGLLAWGRSRLWSRDHGATPLAPRWLRLRVGPYLRRERDKRNYFLLFGAGDAVSGLAKAMILRTVPRVEEEALFDAPPPDPAVIIFRSRQDNDVRADFAPLRGRGAELLAALSTMTRPRFRPACLLGPHVAIHVRLGDFAQAEGADLDSGRQNARIGLDWYIRTLEALRKGLGESIPARVYSDGSDAELASLLKCERVSRMPSVSAVTDLLSIAQADALIGSGSGFSVWGSLLGDVPRLSRPGQELVKVLTEPAAETAWDIGLTLSEDFVRAIAARQLKAGRAPCAA